jgi:alkanesulfonate monooxygenase SsuD/methylene tetrahydromethanopterin reductase-like flavin-dependent oxidoreductase (luciferase family)
MPFLVSEDFLTPAKMSARLQMYREAAGQEGRSPAEADRAVECSRLMQKVHLAATTAKAREFAGPYVLWRYQKVHEMEPPAPKPTLARKLRRRAPVLRPMLSAPHLKEPSEITENDLVSFDLFGTPDDCIARLLEFEKAGVCNVICWFSYGGMPDEAVRRSMTLFAREVMPAFERAAAVA